MLHDLLKSNQNVNDFFFDDTLETGLVFMVRFEDSTSFIDDLGHIFSFQSATITNVDPIQGNGCGDFSLSKVAYTESSSDFILPNLFTLDYMVKLTTINNWHSMISLGTYTNGILIRNNSNDHLYVNGVNASNLGVSPIPVDNNWHHVSIDRDSENDVRLIVDNNIKSIKRIVGTINSTGNKITLGASSHAFASERMIGNMDYIRLLKGRSRYEESL